MSAEYCEYASEFCEFRNPGAPFGSRLINQSQLDDEKHLGEKELVNQMRNNILIELVQELRGEINLEDENLSRFLYARKFNMPRAIELFKNYYHFKYNHSDMFRETDSTKQAFKDGFPMILKERDRKGRKVLCVLMSNWKTCSNISYSIIDLYKAVLITLEKLSFIKHNQLCGFVIIIDLSSTKNADNKKSVNNDFSYQLEELDHTNSHKYYFDDPKTSDCNNFVYNNTTETIDNSSNMTGINFKLIKLFIDGLQDCFPAKLKALHILGEPWYIDGLIQISKPFIKAKLRNRIHTHGNNLSELLEHLPADVLPTELGGYGSAVLPDFS